MMVNMITKLPAQTQNKNLVRDLRRLHCRLCKKSNLSLFKTKSKILSFDIQELKYIELQF